MFCVGMRFVFLGALFLVACDDGAPGVSEDIDPQNIASVALGGDVDWDLCRNSIKGRSPYVFAIMANFTLQLQSMEGVGALSTDAAHEALVVIQQANQQVATGNFDEGCAILQELAGSLE